MSAPQAENAPSPQTDAGAKAFEDLKREAIEFVKMILWFLILFGILKVFIIEGYEVQGDSMEPTLHDRERILVFKLPHNLSKLRPFAELEAIKPGDVVVFNSFTEPNKRYVKRVIACGPRIADTNTVTAGGHGENAQPPPVCVRFDKGAVYVNQKRIEDAYVAEPNRTSDERYDEVAVEPHTYYVLGDNRRVSKDSRSFGLVDDSYVIGKALLRFWPLHKFGLIR